MQVILDDLSGSRTCGIRPGISDTDVEVPGNFGSAMVEAVEAALEAVPDMVRHIVSITVTAEGSTSEARVCPVFVVKYVDKDLTLDTEWTIKCDRVGLPIQLEHGAPTTELIMFFVDELEQQQRDALFVLSEALAHRRQLAATQRPGSQYVAA